RAVQELLLRSAQPTSQSLVTVLKVFQTRRAHGPGMLSFTGTGTSIALGFPNEGERTLRQLDALDEIVLGAGGKLYPAKDARMSAASFARSFPEVEKFIEYVDPVLSSNFWRRVAPSAESAGKA
ncbi:MAG: FAD-binding protein, partial [Planctomycetota bacterium]